MMINKENLQQSLICFTLAVLIIIIIIYLLSLFTHCICAKCRGRTLKLYVEDKRCVNTRLLTLKHATDEKRVDIYDRSDYQLRCMYAECCGYILMSASPLCIHLGMSACFARPFVH